MQEIGRGMHGKVKLARNLETGDNVAIKIIPRFSKKRRLGKVTAMSHQDKTKKEIAILKKIRHPNVVALLEVIDDPELKKIYMILEHVELGEINWRKKGMPHVSQYERRRIEREMRGEQPSTEEELYDQMLERRQALKELKRAKMAQNYGGPADFWSVEHGAAEDRSSVGHWSRISSGEDFAATDGSASRSASRRSSLAPSRPYSISSSPDAPGRPDDGTDWTEDMVTPGPLQTASVCASALDEAVFGASADDERCFRARSPSMADSIISHMSSIDYNSQVNDSFADDLSYVPCFTFEQARSAFRDTVLGLEYLHYQGVVHRDIKPANLLRSRDHRVKISDFGVSYFGRPFRDGEPDDLVSESEATDFDDDLELSKTVGTPAFFAPELCYTDLDNKAQPKVSEQIDVWSLGVTLYCVIYARIPFLAEDEFQMFRKIATEDVYIPRRRLKPVNPSTSPAATSLYKRQNDYPYRDENDLEYEDVDNLLYDLLRQMLIKNPEKRIRLKDIKRHPWVLQGIGNSSAWLEDTDPARPSSGRKIQVDERDLSSAVVPLTFLERARSVVRKTIGKVMHPLVDRSDSQTRRRATSSAASSVGESMLKNAPSTTQPHNDRRRSLHPDDYFPHRPEEISSGAADSYPTSPLTASTQPEPVAYDPMATVLPPLHSSSALNRGRSHSELGEAAKQDYQLGSARLSHWNGKLPNKRSNNFLQLMPHLSGLRTMPGTPLCDGHQDLRWDIAAKGYGSSPTSGDNSRSHSMDRCLFTSADKRAPPQVSLNTAVAPGSIQGPRSMRPMRSVDLGKGRYSFGLSSSPLSSSPQSVTAAYQHRQPQSDPNFAARHQTHVDERPLAEHLVEDMLDVRSPLTRDPATANTASCGQIHPAHIPCPPSPAPVDRAWMQDHPEAPSRGDTMTTMKSVSTDSIDRLCTPLTSPSDAASPLAACPPHKSMLAFQSDPSLPALLSGASSVSADLEGELLLKPGIVSAQLQTRDTLTSPALAKGSTGGPSLDHGLGNHQVMENGPYAVHLRASSSSTSHAWESNTRLGNDDDDDGSDDELLLMASKSRRRLPILPKRRPFEARRRDTNISTASDETAKRVNVHSE